MVNKFSIDLNPIYYKFKRWEHLFFFYERGLKTAIEVILQQYEYPIDEDRRNNPFDYVVFTHLDEYLDQMMQVNIKVPVSVNDVIDWLGIIVEDIDKSIFEYFKPIFNQMTFQIVNVERLSIDNHYVLTIDAF